MRGHAQFENARFTKDVAMKKSNSIDKRVNRPHALKFEVLESRELLSADGASGIENVFATEGETSGWYDLSSSNLNPTAIEQELLEQINRFRQDPQGELNRIFSVATADSLVARNSLVNAAISLTSYPSDTLDVFYEEFGSIITSDPLAFNSALESAAASHTSYMKSRNDISHQCTGEASLDKRVSKAGFVAGSNDAGVISVGENIGGSFIANGDWSVASYIQAAFAVDWGVPTHDHRDTLTNAAYSEIGISVQQTSKSVGPYLVTCDLGTSVTGARTDGGYLLGVVYDDLDGDVFYDVGEGLGGISVLIERLDSSSGESVTVSSWESGGYQIFLANGSYRITVSGDGFSSAVTKMATISDGANVKLDFLTSDAGAGAPVVDLNGEDEGGDYTVVFTEGSEEPLTVFSPGGVAITDEDSLYLYGAKIIFGERPDAANETLDISVSGTDLEAAFEEQSGCITITGTGTIEEYEAAIESLLYFNSSELCTLTEHTLFISVYDGANWSADALLTVSIQPTKLPQMTVHELAVYEGDEDSKAVSFSVELDSPARLDVSFNFNVVPGGDAIEGESFVISKGDPIVIPAGETSATIECYIIGNYDALKPEGLAEIEGGYENPSTDFYLEIVDVENAYLTNENSLAKGTIYDDDSPIILGTTDGYSYPKTLSTDSGQRRYNFLLTPSSSGVFTWNADTLGLPEGTVLTVRENSLESDAIAVSKVTVKGGNVQWFADPDVEYWITVEADADFSSLAARLLAITDGKLVLVDPLFESEDTNLVELMWMDEDVEISVGDLFWDLGADFMSGSTFQTHRHDLEFGMRMPAFTGGSATSGDDSSVFEFDDQRGVTTVGFNAFVFSGSDENEELKLVGTSGNDYLYYSEGKGYFQRSDGKMYRFDGVNSVTIDGGGGEDNAYIEDSSSDDRMETTNGTLALYGGGYSLSTKSFSDVRVHFNKGGDDTYLASDTGDDLAASVSKTAIIFTGTFTPSDETAETGDESEVATKSYVRTVDGVEHLILDPTESIGSVVLYGDNGSSSYLNSEVGSVSTVNTRAEITTEIRRVKSLVLSGLNPIIDERLTVQLPSEYRASVDGSYTVIVDQATGWSLSVPVWKNIGTGTSSVLDESLTVWNEVDATVPVNVSERAIPQCEGAPDKGTEEIVLDFACLDEAFAEWPGYDDGQEEATSTFVMNLDFVNATADFDAFELAHTLKKKNRSALKRN